MGVGARETTASKKGGIQVRVFEQSEIMEDWAESHFQIEVKGRRWVVGV